MKSSSSWMQTSIHFELKDKFTQQRTSPCGIRALLSSLVSAEVKEKKCISIDLLKLACLHLICNIKGNRHGLVFFKEKHFFPLASFASNFQVYCTYNLIGQ